METLFSVLAKCISFELQSRTGEATDLLTEQIDNTLLEGEFDLVNDFLREIKVDDCSTDILLTILTATLPASSELFERNVFVSRVRAEFESRCEPVESLMGGLE
jgi:hypothetical protein